MNRQILSNLYDRLDKESFLTVVQEAINDEHIIIHEYHETTNENKPYWLNSAR